MQNEQRSAKWFTSARKFPQLIGRTPDGTQLWGGPYTITQLVVGAMVAVLLWLTPGLWAQFGLAGNIVVGPAILIGAVVAAGKLPFGMRNPVVVAGGWLHVLSSSVSPEPAVRLRSPHRARGSVRVVAGWVPGSVSGRYELPETDQETRSLDLLPPRPAAPPLTGVQQLLAARSS